MLLLVKDHKEKLRIYNNYVEQQKGFEYEDILDLIKKGYVEDFSSDKVLKTYIDEKRTIKRVKDVKLLELYLVTPKFKEGILVDDDEAAKEAWDAYPKVLKIDGRMQTALNMPYEQFEEAYAKIVNGNGIFHKKIVEMFIQYKRLVKEGKSYGMGIKRALEQKHWEVIEAMIELENEEQNETFVKQR